MQVKCVHPFADHRVGDVIDVPDGASVSWIYFEPLPSGTTPSPPEPPAAATPAAEGVFGQKGQ